jgi:hypothetical protein
MSLVFTQEDHTYRLDGEPLPSVSRIKSPLTDFSMVDPEVLQRAADFGTACHKMVELHLAGQLDMSSLDENLFGCLDAWELFLSEVNPFEGPGVIIDVKSRKYDRVADPVQLAAYHQLWIESGAREPLIEQPMASAKFRFAGTPDIIIPHAEGDIITDWRILYLGRDGKYQYTSCYDRNAWPMFGQLLGDYWRAQTTKTLINSWRNR